MTRFVRRGHLRTSSLGTPYWVGEHDVSRNDWSRSFGEADPASDDFAEKLRMACANRGATSAFVYPNANCPVCGDPVFFYQNQFGSKVYFDELGKPWPKHPCTDNSTALDGLRARGDIHPEAPAVRGKRELAEIEDWLDKCAQSPQWTFWESYGQSQWSAFCVAKRINVKNRALLVLDSLNAPADRRLFLSGAKVPKAVKHGQLVFYYRNWLNYFDLDAMGSVELEVRRIPSASAFVDVLVLKE
jgi:hypothetical protein